MKLLVLGLLQLSATVALANDGIGSVSAGGIVFGKTTAIAMKKEVLYVSHDKISVDYDFINESSAEVEETIVFPLPAYSAAYHDGEMYYGQPADFVIQVDGKAVPYQTVLRATLEGKDVTPALKGAGLTEAQIAYFPSFSPFDKAKAAALTAQQQKTLIGQGLLAHLGESDTEWVPAWLVQVNYVWKQKFPAAKTVHVYHQYQPFVAAGPGQSGLDENFKKDYCADPAFYASWKKLAAKSQDYVNANWVSYILTTGNTWKNGIEDFTLNLVKRDPGELISLCFPGSFKKINPTTLQVQLKNFKPGQELKVYFGNVQGGAAGGVAPRLNR